MRRLSEKKLAEARKLLLGGSSRKDIAEALEISKSAVSTIARDMSADKTAGLALNIEERLDDDDLVEKLRATRDRLAHLVDGYTKRLGVELETMRPSRDTATTVGILTDKLQQVTTQLRLLDTIDDESPKEDDEREREYIQILRVMAGGGSLPAAKQLAKAWGIEENADRATVTYYFDDADGDDKDKDDKAAN